MSICDMIEASTSSHHTSTTFLSGSTKPNSTASRVSKGVSDVDPAKRDNLDVTLVSFGVVHIAPNIVGVCTHTSPRAKKFYVVWMLTYKDDTDPGAGAVFIPRALTDTVLEAKN